MRASPLVSRCVGSAALTAWLFLTSPSAVAQKLQYNRDIRPILAENCFACHGPDSAARKADLRLDLREVAVNAEAIVPGRPEKSELVARIFETDPKRIMPTPKSHKTLTPAQKEILKRWIAEGAEYQPHWSFIPPTRPPLPSVKNPQWIRTPIDRFILAELEKHGLSPAPEADRRTLARRLALDLTGLPPAVELVERFVADQAPNAYEKLVDELLKAPTWGEHRGRYWLDAARYGDTHGIHFDNYREMWAYRDWVIKAFNENKRFDQFTVEQLAGDLLPNASLDQKIASGFNRCNITTNEGGVIAEEYLVLYTRDRTETTSTVWLGLTANCAVCHDHKFDPLSQREFYEMAAFFNNTTQGAMDGNKPDTPPILLVPNPADEDRLRRLEPELAKLQEELAARKKIARAEFTKWLEQAQPNSVAKLVPHEKLTFHAPLDTGEGAVITGSFGSSTLTFTGKSDLLWEAGSDGKKAYFSDPDNVVTFPEVGDFEKDQHFTVSTWVKINRRGESGAIVARMDEANDFRGWDVWHEAGRIGMHIIHSWNGNNAIKILSRSVLQNNQWIHVTLSYDGSGKASGISLYLDGKPQPIDVLRDSLSASIKTTTPFKLAQRSTGSRLLRLGLEDLRIYDRVVQPHEVPLLVGQRLAERVIAQPMKARKAKDLDALFSWWESALDTASRELTIRIAALEQEKTQIRSRGTVAHVMNEKSGEAMAFILARGDYDKRKEPVKAGTPKVLPPFPSELPRNRLGFAQWLLRPEHPLTARVTVNRFWQEVFGTGLVKTSGDFGITGDLPSHPELLDWLAVEFRESGWDVKKFFKLLVMSSTYRQAAVTTPAKLEKDSANRLLSRGPRFRMDAEMIRDQALAVSGLLRHRIGGPSVRPYQPDGVWEAVAMPESNTRIYRREVGDNLYRRSLYTFWKRAAPPASMEIFNAPNRETCTVRRERTNTPLQALVTLNDEQFVEAARVLAEKVIKDGGADEAARLDYLARRVLCRPFRTEETAIVKASLDELLAHYKGAPAEAKKLLSVGEQKPDTSLDPATVAAWAMLCNELLNLDEVLNK